MLSMLGSGLALAPPPCRLQPGLSCLRLRKRAGSLSFSKKLSALANGSCLWSQVSGEGGGPGGPGKGNSALGSQVPLVPDERPAAWRSPALPGLLPHRHPPHGAATLHRRRLRDPEPAGRGPMGPSPWWDLSPALAMRLHLLASLSGGGLGRAGGRRWLAGEGQVCWALGGMAWGCGVLPTGCGAHGRSSGRPGAGHGHRHTARLPVPGRCWARTQRPAVPGSSCVS